MTINRIVNPLNLKKLNPIIFYSKNDELEVHLSEVEEGELFIKSLSTEMITVKGVVMQENKEKLSWKQDGEGLRITISNKIKVSNEQKECVINVLF
ncbi:hypothetical protein [Pedobacter punctiformis]|uniref:Uncharacterized protein n=1 Tax=Pedobacter punctiformis TaxID=3004097 RepID=A0ABT4L864_9SPHI|nr:hypothetical protein [Pedobacter sp. HCMS5-2]MCZ4244108.1 hypothetical protein [Pedobacter sp. HCMS5-2]